MGPGQDSSDDRVLASPDPEPVDDARVDTRKGGLMEIANFAHGQFMMLQAPAEDALLVAFATRGEREYVERFAVTLPPTVKLHRIEAETDGAGAALSLLARSMRCFDQLVERSGGAPTLQGLPPWGRALYGLEP